MRAYLEALVPTLAIIAGLILAIEIVVQHTVNAGEDPPCEGFWRAFQCRQSVDLASGGGAPHRRIFRRALRSGKCRLSAWQMLLQRCSSSRQAAKPRAARADREMRNKKFRGRKLNMCEPINRTQKRELCIFDAFRFLTIPAPLINRVRDNSDDSCDEMARVIA